jgi:hypothetical protein
MAKTVNNNASEIQPLIGLRDEAVEHLNAIGVELDEADKDLDALDKIGMDTSRLRERVEWGKNARKVILERFGKKA